MSLRFRLFLSLFATLTPVLRAQTAAPAAPPSWTDPDDSGQLVRLDTISVTATRTPNKAFDLPGMTTVIDGAQLDQLAPASMGEVLKLIPNVNIGGGPRASAESLNIRGKDDDTIIILLDGARQNFKSLPTTRFFVETDLLKSVEVVRGPNSALYGNGGLGGVIAMETKDAADLLAPGARYGLRTKLGYETSDEGKLASVTAAARPSDQLDVVVAGTVRDSENIRVGDGTTLPYSAARWRSGLAKAEWQPLAGLQLAATVVMFVDDETVPNNPTVQTPTSIVDRHLTVDNYKLGADYRPAGQDWIDAKLALYAVENETIDASVSVTSPATSGTAATTALDTRGIDFSNTSQLAWIRPQRLTYGADYVRDEQRATAGGVTNIRIPDGEVASHGYFVQDEIKLASSLTLTPGLRYDSYSVTGYNVALETTEEAVTPKLGTTWKPLPWFTIFALYSEGFQSPDIGKLFRSGTHFRTTIGPGRYYQQEFIANPGLKPEKSQNYEAGVGFERDHLFTAGDHGHFKISLFQVDGQDSIDSSTVTLPITAELAAAGVVLHNGLKFVNLGATTARGVEAELAYSSRWLYATAAYSSMRATDDATGAKLNTTPADKLVLSAAVRPVSGWSFGTRLRIVASRKDKVTTASLQAPGYTVADLFLSCEPRWLPWQGRIDLGVDNVTDKAYGSEDMNRLEEGRSAKGSVTFRF